MIGSNYMADQDWTEMFVQDSYHRQTELADWGAPFTRNEDGGYSFVYKQPENDEETQQCQEAMEGCPVEAIGDGG